LRAALRAVKELRRANIATPGTIPAQLVATLGAELKVRCNLEPTVRTVHSWFLRKSFLSVKPKKLYHVLPGETKTLAGSLIERLASCPPDSAPLIL
jgi:hypothetical protein